jgi:TM2 domain-containing membrane protein YozV
MTLVFLLLCQSAIFNLQSAMPNPVTPREARSADSRGLSGASRDSSTALRSAQNDREAETALGDSLLKHGFDAQAVQEFKRELWEDRAVSDNPAKSLYHLKLGLGLAAGNQLFAAAQELRSAGQTAPELADPAQTALAGFYARSGRYDLASFELSDLLVFTRDSLRRATLNSAIGWLRLQEGDVTSAASSYDLAGRPDVASLLRSAEPPPHRNSTVAALLSTFVPGSGETYAGKPGTGLLSLAVTAGSLTWAVLAAKSDDWVSASVIVSTLFWRFYNGSRANAVAFADEHNSAARHRRIASLTPHVAEPDWFAGTDSLIGYEVRPETTDGGAR